MCVCVCVLLHACASVPCLCSGECTGRQAGDCCSVQFAVGNEEHMCILCIICMQFEKAIHTECHRVLF